MICKKQNGGFTVMETLVAVSIFTAVGLIGVTVFVNILRTQQRISLENAIYEDTSFMMQRITREIRQNIVDYEEYYNKSSAKPGLYGDKYGCYAAQFYNPGSDGALGAKCNDNKSPASPNCTVNKNTIDINTGQNPYARAPGIDPKTANAFCRTSATCNPTAPTPPQKELYLINSSGAEKTIFALKAMDNGLSPERALAIVRIAGKDNNNDGIVEAWNTCGSDTTQVCCSKNFDCVYVETGPLESSLKTYDPAKIYKGFVPISPGRTDIKALNFYISPLEDPRKAFNETDIQTQQQPHVTVVLTTKPAKAVLKGYAGEIPEITLQTTVVSSVPDEVKSFNASVKCSLS